jgi:proteasome lid subunit RPN8/RPN11
MTGSLSPSQPLTLTLSSAACHTLAGLARPPHSRERCGVLVGKRNELATEVWRTLEARNTYRLPCQFGISADEHDRLQRACASAERIVGIFHTHLATTEPSVSDISNMRLYPYIWLIVSHGGPQSWRSYVWRHDQLREVAVLFADVASPAEVLA